MEPCGLGRTQGPEVLQAMLDRAGALRTAEARGEAPTMQTWVPESHDGLEEGTLWREGSESYCTPRGRHPRSNTGWVLRSIDRLAQYDSYAMIEFISPRPLLMITGSRADTGYFSREAVEKANEPKELFVVDGATHVDLDDKDEYVTPAVAKLSDFFGERLAA
ncbi:alpha/beta hydrolase [Streptomyces sp. NPDC001970]